jgi:LysM repeat protein
VKKGDNPVTIARRLKVSYGDLITLNHIEDPRKLRIGQKLLIPTTNQKKNKK